MSTDPDGGSAIALPDLPDGWDYSSLESHLVDKGLSYGVVQPGADDPNGIPVLRVGNLRDGRISADDPLRISPEVERSYERTRLHGGEVVLSLVGSVGEVAVVPQQFNGWNVARAIGVLRPSDPAQAEWLKLCLQAPVAQRYMHMWQTTTVQATLNLRDVRRLPIVVPPLYEKRAIACILGSLDDKIEGNRRLVALSDDLWQASASKELDRIECADDEKAEGDGDVQPLTSLANFVNGRAFTKNATGSGRMVIRIAELNNGPGASTVYNDLDLAPDYLASPGDLLFAWSGSLTVQRWFRPEAIINQHIFKVVPSQGTPVWLVHAHLLRLLPGYKRIASGKATTMGHIQRRDLELPVGVPGQDVLERLDSVCLPLWHRSLNAEVESLRLASLRNSLLPRLLSGELRVREAEAIVEEAV